MLDEGEQAPHFELPGVRDDEIEQVALAEYLGEDVVILAFYPGDFNPACSDGSTDLDELDLFTMQKDVSILAISSDTVFSHRAFADEYDLHIPLLSDLHAEVATQYGVAADDESGGYLIERAVVVINPDETVEYTWIAADLEDLPDTDEIRAAVEGVGGDETAEARYRVGHAHYIEGRRAFTSAMQAYEEKEWMMAQGDFERAYEEFAEARDEFNTAHRFGEDETALKYFDRAEQKTEALWRASDWLGDSANAFASGEGGKAEKLRQDAETPLETARDIHEPPEPDEFPPDVDPASLEDDADEEVSVLPDEEIDDGDASLAVDIDAEADEIGTADGIETSDGTTADTGPDADPESTSGSETASMDDDPGTTQDSGETQEPQTEAKPESDIDDEELEEIAAELEEQTENADQSSPDQDAGGNVVPDKITLEEDGESDPEDSGDEATADDTADETGEVSSDEELDEDDIELDLTDPTEGQEGEDDEDEEDDEREDITDEDFGDGDHGVPDSL